VHLQSYERLRPSKDVTKAYKESPRQPAAPRGVELEITRETKALPPLPASFDASSKDEEHMEWLIPDEGMAPTIEDAWKQESEDTKRWGGEETVRLILEIMKEREKRKEPAEQQNERDSRNDLIGSSAMATSTGGQEILNISITNKYGPDYSRHATNHGPVHHRSRHSIQNETYIDQGQYVGTSDGKTILRVPSLDGTC